MPNWAARFVRENQDSTAVDSNVLALLQRAVEQAHGAREGHVALAPSKKLGEGLMMSVLTLMGMTLSAPDHSRVSRRAVVLPVIQPAHVPLGPLHVVIDSTGLQVYGAGQWLEAKHGAKSHRT